MRVKTKPPKFTETFDRPESFRLGLLLDQSEKQAKLDEWLEDDLRKLSRLAEHLNIEPGPARWLRLSLALARQLYPTPDKRGVERKWDATIGALLVIDMDRERSRNAARPRSVQWACNRLEKREPWARFIGSRESGASSADPAGSLRKAYYSALGAEWTASIQKIVTKHLVEQSDDDWIRFVTEIVKN